MKEISAQFNNGFEKRFGESFAAWESRAESRLEALEKQRIQEKFKVKQLELDKSGSRKIVITKSSPEPCRFTLERVQALKKKFNLPNGLQLQDSKSEAEEEKPVTKFESKASGGLCGLWLEVKL